MARLRRARVTSWLKMRGWAFTFRRSITLGISAFVFALAALLIVVQEQILRVAAEDAASADMDAASAKSLGRLEGQVSEVVSLVGVLSTSSSLAN